MLHDGKIFICRQRAIVVGIGSGQFLGAQSPRQFTLVERAIAALPLAQREVITLRDIEARSASEVCNALGLTETNQRVLLHRARSRVRTALEPYLSEHT